LSSLDGSYKSLISFAFEREGDLDSWVWDLDLEEPKMSSEELVTAIQRLCLNSGLDLARFTNLQVAGGLTYIFNNSFSDFSFSLLDENVAPDLRSKTLLSLSCLFSDCFAVRCTNETSHGLKKSSEDPLNSICYMFWDVSPLSNGGQEVLQVMENSLYLKNIACVESGLHGLGHRFYYDEQRVEKIIDKFLASDLKIDDGLIEYAKNARKGYV
jgi:hypothetical protein